MAHHVEFTGPAGELRWGYHPAATLTNWALVARPGGGTLTASVLTTSPVAITQPGLSFIANRREWPILSFSLEGQSLVAEVGPQKG